SLCRLAEGRARGAPRASRRRPPNLAPRPGGRAGSRARRRRPRKSTSANHNRAGDMLRFSRMPTSYRIAGLVLVAAGFATAISGCSLPFYLQAVNGHLELMRKSTPIERLLMDPELDD